MRHKSLSHEGGIRLLALALIIAPLAPASHAIKIGTVLAERLLYVPSFGFMLLLGLLYDALKRSKWLRRVCFLLVLALYSSRAMVRSQDWSNDATLWKATTESVPRSAKAWKGLSNVVLRKGGEGGFIEARETALRAIEIHPSYGEGYGALGHAYQKLGQVSEAVHALKTSLRLSPGEYETAVNLGAAFGALGEMQQAWNTYSIALQHHPGKVAAYNNLGQILQQTGDWKAAVRMFEMGIKAEPKGEDVFAAFYNMGNAYVAEEPARAVENYVSALKLRPGMAQIYFNMGIAHHSLKNVESAAESLEIATHLQPDDPDAYNNLGHTLEMLGQQSKAKKAFGVVASLKQRL